MWDILLATSRYFFELLFDFLYTRSTGTQEPKALFGNLSFYHMWFSNTTIYHEASFILLSRLCGGMKTAKYGNINGILQNKNRKKLLYSNETSYSSEHKRWSYVSDNTERFIFATRCFLSLTDPIILVETFRHNPRSD